MEIAVWIISLSQLLLLVFYVWSWTKHFQFQARAEKRYEAKELQEAKDRIQYISAKEAYKRGVEDGRKNTGGSAVTIPSGNTSSSIHAQQSPIDTGRKE